MGKKGLFLSEKRKKGSEKGISKVYFRNDKLLSKAKF